MAAQAVLNVVGRLLPQGDINVDEIVCKLSNEGSDVRCSVCGQGFLVYWAKFSRTEQEHSRRVIQEALRGHHAGEAAGLERSDVHPRESFTVAAASVEPEYAAAAEDEA